MTNYDDLIVAKQNHRLFAPEEFWLLTDSQRSDICNGCGTKGIVGWIVPDSILGVDITMACDIHDYMYNAGEIKADKFVADDVFLNNMLRLIDAHGGCATMQKMRCKIARKYYLVVKEYGGPAFWAGKNDEVNLGPLTPKMEATV